MIPLDEFYSRSPRERRDLIDSGHVVINGETATDVPNHSCPDIYVFEKPVIEQVVDMLQRGQYKTREIAPELPLNRKALDDILADLRYDRLMDFNWPFERNSSGSVRTSLSKGRFITRTSGQRVNQITDSSASFLQRISYWAVEPKWTTSDTCDDGGCHSVSPRTPTAAALHAAFDITGSEDRPTLTELSEVLDVAASTISQRKSDLLEYREIWE